MAVSGNLAGKIQVVDNVLLSREQICATTVPDEKCIEFECQTDWNYYVGLRQTFLALKLDLAKNHDCDTYKVNVLKQIFFRRK